MEGLTAALSGVISVDKLMATFTTLVPVIGGVLIFAFTYSLVKKVIKGASKGKARV